ncbi:hypothetical protein [Roseibium sp.]|uniref:hypothetical protein n=1 Tax=Roseibium sp. TaxID=1936156 RepID=UPI003B516AD3
MKTFIVSLKSPEDSAVQLDADGFEICGGELHFHRKGDGANEVVSVFTAGSWSYFTPVAALIDASQYVGDDFNPASVFGTDAYIQAAQEKLVREHEKLAQKEAAIASQTRGAYQKSDQIRFADEALAPMPLECEAHLDKQATEILQTGSGAGVSWAEAYVRNRWWLYRLGKGSLPPFLEPSTADQQTAGTCGQQSPNDDVACEMREAYPFSEREYLLHEPAYIKISFRPKDGSDPLSISSYMQASTSFPARPGEDWRRGDDLPDGPFNVDTFNSIMDRIWNVLRENGMEN